MNDDDPQNSGEHPEIPGVSPDQPFRQPVERPGTSPTEQPPMEPDRNPGASPEELPSIDPEPRRNVESIPTVDQNIA